MGMRFLQFVDIADGFAVAWRGTAENEITDLTR